MLVGPVVRGGRAAVDEPACIAATDLVAADSVAGATGVTAQHVRLGLETGALRLPPSDVSLNRRV